MRGNRNEYFVSVSAENVFLVEQKREEREAKAIFFMTMLNQLLLSHETID